MARPTGLSDVKSVELQPMNKENVYKQLFERKQENHAMNPQEEAQSLLTLIASANVTEELDAQAILTSDDMCCSREVILDSKCVGVRV